MKPEIDLLAPDLLSGHVELVGQVVRVPGQHSGHRHVAAAGLGELLEVATLNNFHQRRGLGPGPSDSKQSSYILGRKALLLTHRNDVGRSVLKTAIILSKSSSEQKF